jgi:chromatin assembly factor 1 subunit A
MNSMMNSLNTPSNYTYASGSGKSKPPRRLIPAEHLPEFKAEVEGSDLTKIALIEALKKKYACPLTLGQIPVQS